MAGCPGQPTQRLNLTFKQIKSPGYWGELPLLWATFLLLPSLAQCPAIWLEWTRGGHPLHQAELQRPVRHPRQVQGAPLLCRAELWAAWMVQGWRQVPLAQKWGQGQEHHPLQVTRPLTPKAASKLSVISSNNQSLIIMDVKKEDSGRFTCVAESGAGFRVSHTTRLESFPPPVFSHPPIWNSRPEDTMVGAHMLTIRCYCPSARWRRARAWSWCAAWRWGSSTTLSACSLCTRTGTGSGGWAGD